MSRYLIIFLVLLFLSCDNTLKVYTEISEAGIYIETWQDYEGDSRIIEYVERSDADLAILELDNPILGDVMGRTSGTLADGRCTIEVINNRQLILHEVGHCYSYIHSENPNSIMCAIAYKSATNFIDLKKGF